jgi:hypothetical protein
MVVGVSLCAPAVGLAQQKGAEPSPNPAPQQAENLGIAYELVPYKDAFGARLTDDAPDSAPVGNLELKRGDMIVALDGEPIRSPKDLLRHYSLTKVDFVKSGELNVKRAVVHLPGMAVRAALTQPALRRAAALALRSGAVDYRPPEVRIDGDTVFSSIGYPKPDYEVDQPILDQLQVEIIRLTRNRANQRTFWEPYLQRVEAVIAGELATPNLEPGDPRAEEFRKRIDAIYDEALRANAAMLGKVYQPVPPVAERGIFTVVLKSTTGQKSIYAMPYLNYLLRREDAQRRPIQLIEYSSFPTNQPLVLSGKYIYTTPGQPSVVDTFTVNDSGTVSVR